MRRAATPITGAVTAAARDAAAPAGNDAGKLLRAQAPWTRHRHRWSTVPTAASSGPRPGASRPGAPGPETGPRTPGQFMPKHP